MTDSRKTVLLVDDAEPIHLLARELLRGYRLLGAFSGREAMAALGEREVDLVLLDVNLPDASGLELVGRIHHRQPSLPVLMLSSDFSAETVALAIHRGATGFLAKWPENLVAVRAGVASQIPEPLD